MANVLLGPMTLGLRGTLDDADVDMRGEYSHPLSGANRILTCPEPSDCPLGEPRLALSLMLDLQLQESPKISTLTR